MQTTEQGGVQWSIGPATDVQTEHQRLRAWLGELGLPASAVLDFPETGSVNKCRVALGAPLRAQWAPDHDTTQLVRVCELDTFASSHDLDAEIVLAMLCSPTVFEFPALAEFQACVRARRYTVQASRKSSLAFATQAAERPEDCWVYLEGRGFVLRSGHSLIDSLIKATQPAVSGMQYSFSCYRATEYVMLLGIAMTLRDCNPELLAQLESQWRQRSIMSAAFHETFLVEYGSTDQPLPPRYFVPGDRLWFRNPDAASSDVTGYEGSWVIYLGNGHFSDFWRAARVYTLESKCIEIYHWRDGLVVGDDGNPGIDEDLVDEHVRATNQHPARRSDILAKMMRYRDLRGQQTPMGGCLDSTREYARALCPGTTTIYLPQL